MKRWLSVVTLLLMLSGCGTKLVYDNLDWFAIRFIEQFVELETQQQDLVSDAIDHATPWHRRSEIPIYISHLDELLVLDPKQVTPQSFRYQQEKLREHSLRLARHFMPSIVALVSQMNDEQVESLMDEIRIRHTQFKNKYQDSSEVELRQRYRQKIEESLTEWLGELTPEQALELELWSQQWLVTTPLWIEYQTQVRVELMKLFAKRADSLALQHSIEALLYQPEQFYGPELALRIDYNTELGRKYLVNIINNITPEQTQRFRSELQDWRDIASELVNEFG